MPIYPNQESGMTQKPSVIADPASHRTVVMLRTKERERLSKLAQDENVSTGEIIRRAILAYDPERDKEVALRPLVELWRESTERTIKAVDKTIADVDVVRQHINAVLEQ